MQQIDKAIEGLESDDFDLKTDIGYKFLLNWCLKRIAESFMVDNPLISQNLRAIYSRLEFMLNFFPYFGDADVLTRKIQKIVIINGREVNMRGFSAIKPADFMERQKFYYTMLSTLRNIMKEMDSRKLLLHSYATVVFEYDGLKANEPGIKDDNL